MKYALWIEKESPPAKSFKEHPIDSVDMLERLKKQFQNQAKLSLGKYIRLKRVNHILCGNEANIQKLLTHYIQTPLGIMIAVHTERGLCLLEFADRKMLESELKDIQKHTNRKFSFSTNKQSQQLEQQLHEYFSGHRKLFDVPLDFIGTDFQKKIWNLLLEIPYGECLSYKEQAIKYGDLNSVRAIAGANGKNKISIIVPCHRVIGSNGELIGYGGGIERKKTLLLHEKNLAKYSLN